MKSDLDNSCNYLIANDQYHRYSAQVIFRLFDYLVDLLFKIFEVCFEFGSELIVVGISGDVGSVVIVVGDVPRGGIARVGSLDAAVAAHVCVFGIFEVSIGCVLIVFQLGFNLVEESHGVGKGFVHFKRVSQDNNNSASFGVHSSQSIAGVPWVCLSRMNTAV